MKFNATKTEFDFIKKIADRAVALATRYGIEYSAHDAMMDIEACHSNGNPIRLEALLGADDGNFGHDVFGIRRYLNRETGKLENFFTPRCSAHLPEGSSALAGYCKRGHKMEGENIMKNGRNRMCRACYEFRRSLTSAQRSAS